MGANNCFREGSRGVIKISAVSMRPWHPIFKKPGIRSRGFNDTAGSASMTSSTPLNPIQKIFMLDPAVALRPRNPIPRFHLNRGIRTFQTIISNISATLKPYAKRLKPVNQGARGDCSMKKKPWVENLVNTALLICYLSKKEIIHNM
jgi:hypothetical protein